MPNTTMGMDDRLTVSFNMRSTYTTNVIDVLGTTALDLVAQVVL